MSAERREAEPIVTYPDGRQYYFGTPENLFNFFDISLPQRSLEMEKLLADGGRPPKLQVATSPLSWEQKRQEIYDANRALATTQLLGKFPLESSGLQKPSQDRPAA